jgi:hypothetical protein
MSTLLVNDVVRLSRNCEKVEDFESLKRWVFFFGSLECLLFLLLTRLRRQ